MKRLAFLTGVLFISFIVSSGFCHQAPTESFVLPYNSAATADDISAINFNPAGLGLKRGPQIGFFHTFSDSSFEGDKGLFLSAGKLGFSVEWLGNISAQTYRKYTFSCGGKIVDGFFWGTGYSWFGSRLKAYDELSSWRVGVLVRPFEYLSIGAVAKDLNRPRFYDKRTEVSYDFALAVRPLGGFLRDRLTLSVDGFLTRKQKLKDMTARFRAEAEPLDGFVLFGDIDDEGNFGIGGRINLPHLGVGSYNSVTEDLEFNQGVAYLTLSKDRYRTLLQRKNNFLELKLSGKVVEENTRISIFRKGRPTVMELVREIEKAKKDVSIKGILLRIDPFDMGLAKTQEIREAILDFRESGKKVVAFMESGGNKEYYLATAADKIVLLPTGYLSFTGLSAEIVFIKRTLKKLGIVADLEHIGDYKTASDLLTRESMSPAHKEMVNSLLDDIYDQITSQIAESRGWSVEETRSKIDRGPFAAGEALKENLVDTLLFYDQVDELIKQMAGTKPRRLAYHTYRKQRFWRYSWAIPPKIAVIFATGAIFSGKSGRSFLWGDYMGSETISEAIRKAREDETIKAIVFRVDSPGGSGIASDVILREIKKTKGKKPFVVSMSDVAGSGGYWISCAADTIISMPGTYTGSIGVISGKFSLEGLYEKIGFDIQVVKRGAHADFFTTTREFNREEREVVRRQIEEFYSEFLHRVAEGRGMSEERVDSIGQGRVWTGRQAKENGLVDLLGGLSRAMAVAKKMAGLPEEAEVKIVTFPQRRLFLDLSWRRILSSPDLESIREALKEENLFEEPFLPFMPYVVDIK